MSGRVPHEPELTLLDLLADPMIHLIMAADGIDERELRELFDRTAAEINSQHREDASRPDLAGAPPAFRHGVGIMLLNSAGNVFVGQRIDISEEAWQMPQGGIELGETPKAAALRELREELGTSNVEVVADSSDWLSYELPQDLLERLPAARWKGQTQQWFLMRFLGNDPEINVATEHPEFSRWKWLPPGLLIGQVVPFRRQIYARVLEKFASHLNGVPST